MKNLIVVSFVVLAVFVSCFVGCGGNYYDKVISEHLFSVKDYNSLFSIDGREFYLYSSYGHYYSLRSSSDISSFSVTVIDDNCAVAFNTMDCLTDDTEVSLCTLTPDDEHLANVNWHYLPVLLNRAKQATVTLVRNDRFADFPSDVQVLIKAEFDRFVAVRDTIVNRLEVLANKGRLESVLLEKAYLEKKNKETREFFER
jgi:hypothetical protein